VGVGLDTSEPLPLLGERTVSTVQPLINPVRACPECGSEVTLNQTTRLYICERCGRITREDQIDAQPRANDAHPIMAITHIGEINPWAMASFETAQYAVIRGDNTEALDALKRALENQPDFADAHLWLARLSDDPKVKRDHLSEILANFPGNLEALRDLMVLNGRLTPEQAAQSHHLNDAQIKHAPEAVKTQTTTLKCPVCGGDLTVDDHDGHVECRFCGYRADQAPTGGVSGDILGMALLERKTQKVVWHIGSRLLHCNNCGAERTIPGGSLSARCPFCGTNQVVKQDALASFEQPDGLVPFRLDEREAEAQIRQKVGSMSERLFNLFDTNKVARAELQGTFLPYWVFDAVAQVTETRQPKQNKSRRMNDFMETQRQTYQDGALDVDVCAVSFPSPDLTVRLGDYDLSAVVPYEPKLLARHPAALYDIDFDKASLEARSRINRAMKGKYSAHETENAIVNVFTFVQQMSFRLLLMPVWVANLTEVDGDLRLALVNGQTGETVLGRAHKARRV
jgi:DNA-directed RNA polymerase subunit RPC12/RpoP